MLYFAISFAFVSFVVTVGNVDRHLRPKRIDWRASVYNLLSPAGSSPRPPSHWIMLHLRVAPPSHLALRHHRGNVERQWDPRCWITPLQRVRNTTRDCMPHFRGIRTSVELFCCYFCCSLAQQQLCGFYILLPRLPSILVDTK